MGKHTIYTVLIIFISLESCSLFKNFIIEDDGYYNIDDASIRLIVQHEVDTFIQSNYEKANSLSGNRCKKLEMINLLDSSKQLGVAMRFWPKQGPNDNYGPFKSGGLAAKIKNINIYFSSKESKLEISRFLKGKKDFGPYVWRNKLDTFKPNLLKGGSAYRKAGYLSPNIKDIPALIKMGSSDSEMYLENRLYGFDILFWLNNSIFEDLPFEPELLKMEIEFIDSKGLTTQIITDSTKIINAP